MEPKLATGVKRVCEAGEIIVLVKDSEKQEVL